MDSSIAMQIIKRLISCILVLVFLLFGSNIAWLIVWYQYDYQTVEIEQDTEAENSDNLAWYQYDYQTVEIEQDTEAENSDNLAIIDNEGDISYDLSEDTSSNEEEAE